MKVKMKTIMAGPDGSAMIGQTIVVSDDVGVDLVSGGFAVLIEREIAHETTDANRDTTVVTPLETVEAPTVVTPLETVEARPVKARPRSKKNEL